MLRDKNEGGLNGALEEHTREKCHCRCYEWKALNSVHVDKEAYIYVLVGISVVRVRVVCDCSGGIVRK